VFKCLRAFVERWRGERPAALEFSILSMMFQVKTWIGFLECLVFSNNYIDLAIINIQTTNNIQQVVISNIRVPRFLWTTDLNFIDGTTQSYS